MILKSLRSPELMLLNNVTSYGPLITINSGSWGNVGPSISTVVMAKEEVRFISST